jgi:isoleucyl-tRNA synthetase
LLQLLAPITSFTCEEAWGYLPHRKVDSVFLSGLPQPQTLPGDAEILAEFERLFAVRSEVQRLLEVARRDKLIGSSLEAKVVLSPEGDLKPFLEKHAAELPALLIVSKVELGPAPEGAIRCEALPLAIRIERAPGTKCPRCWNYSEAIDGSHPVCVRCTEALKG